MTENWIYMYGCYDLNEDVGDSHLGHTEKRPPKNSARIRFVNHTRTLRFCALHNWFCNFKLIGRSPPSCVKQTGVEGSLSPANTIHCPIVGSMLGQRRRR